MKSIALAAAALLAPAIALPCSPPPAIWTLDTVWPRDGAVGVPGDAPLVFIGSYGGWTPLGDQVVVAVSLDGEPVPMTSLGSRFEAVSAWSPVDGWIAGETYEVRYALVEDRFFDEPGELNRWLSFTAGDGAMLAPEWAGGRGTPRIRSVTHHTCVDPPDDDYTDTCECNAHEDTGSGWALSLRVTATSPPGAVAMGAELRVAPSVEALAERRARVRKPFIRPVSLDLDAELGEVADWPGESVCWQTTVVGFAGGEASSPAQCVPLTDIEGYADFAADEDRPDELADGGPPDDPADGGPPDDFYGEFGFNSDADQRDDGGCDTTGGVPGGSGWLLALGASLALIRRPRRSRR